MILAGNINYTKIIVTLVIGVAAIITVGYFLRKLTRNSDKIHRRFIGKLAYLTIIIICVTNIIEVANPDLKISSALLKGSALIVAILGFAAQPVISDLICGFLISIHKPFEIGDRIIVEGMDPGIVEDITLRHTVLRIYDNLKVIVPNSVLNSKTLVNTSYKIDRRGIILRIRSATTPICRWPLIPYVIVLPTAPIHSVSIRTVSKRIPALYTS